ncbi:hypothetical protein C8A05DRAFT_43817 [Staphylotrichum tortipilum]|uniref:Trimethyllysine dioxygenase n=1 Tax=Staphylotrichum tortipilum TaxID=2831512 RepID=A0AAN6MM91_9PEZI|nr:hypothetical protein C8A05DRAFT_43817 [Staphylotrichum longicolle]
MTTTQTKVAVTASAGLRVLSYIFLRWPAPAIIFTLFAVYIPAFVSGYISDPKYEVIDEVDVIVTETTAETREAPRRRNRKAVNDSGKEVVAEDVIIKETISVEPRPISPWRTLLSGAPNPRSLALSLTTLLVNALCVGLVADRLFSERYYPADDLSFVRLGYVSDREAKLLIREPDQSKMPVSVEVHIRDPQPPFDNPLWQDAGGVRWTTNETDYTTVLTIPLRHSKKRVYEWRTSNNHSGVFTAPPPVGHADDTTYGPFTFLTTSCIVPRLPYSPFDHPLSIPGFKHLAKVLPSLNAQFMLFLGDFIYADVPRYWDKSVAYYRQKYRQVYASPDWPSVGQNLSWIHVLDDHEIANDWSANSTGVYAAAIDPFEHYQAAANPPLAAGASPATQGQGKTSYFSFTQGPASFFLLDTRSFRSANSDLPATSPNKTMLGAPQRAALLAWLRQQEPRGVKWKIVASSVPFTKNWPVNTQDTWGGFLAERRVLLEAMWDAAATQGEGGVRWPESAAVWEFSASPLSQFYSPVPTYRQRDREDVLVKYIYKGNSKFGAVTIENLEDGDQSSLKYRLYVDGEEAWNTVILSPPTPAGNKAGGSFWDSSYDWEFLGTYKHFHSRPNPEPDRIYWDREIGKNPPTAEYDDVMNSDSGVAAMTSQIVKYGLVFVNNVPYDTPEPTNKLLERIAFIRETHYGGFYDFKPDLALADTAYTNIALPAHTDTTYFTDPAGLQSFHLLSHEAAPGEAAPSGGLSLLVDGFRAALELQKHHGHSYERLAEIPVPWHASGNKGITIGPYRKFPVFETTQDGKPPRRIRWNNDDRGVVPPDNAHAWYKGARKWDELLKKPELQYWFQMMPGQVLIFDNWRVLHGRSAFTGIRRICGGYINRDDFISRWMNTNYDREECLRRVME